LAHRLHLMFMREAMLSFSDMSIEKKLKDEPFILVSASPRRRELLNRLGIEPVVSPVDCREFHDPALSPEKLTLSLAKQKIDSFLARSGPVPVALSADTIVHINGRHLGKPVSRDEAQEMLRLLSGKTHIVSTAFVLILRGKSFERVLSTEVKFHELKSSDIDYYLNSGEWIDAAGAYKIQEGGEILINWIKGSWSNVMGLPISSIYAILRDNNFWGYQ
jgi:septum formation protein